ncbi:propanol-preferring alcohol dehydrogenase [Rhizobium alvei]
MNAMMRAAVLVDFGAPLEIRTVRRPEPKAGQILVRLEACGLCHSDVHIWKGEVRPPVSPDPFVLGHEGVGRIEALGAGVTGWSVGDRAGVPWLHKTCLCCDECRDGEESFCQHQTAHGLNVPGALADYVVVDADFAVRLPGTVDAVQTAPVMCAGVTAYGAIRRARMLAGERLAVFGCGGLGLYAVQIAHRMGIEVVAIDRDPDKLSTARALGANETEIADGGLTERMSEPGRRVHAAINFAPTTRTWPAMLSAIRPRGRIVAAALVSEPVGLNQEWLTGTGVTITGTSVGTRKEMQELVALHAANPLTAPIEEISLEQVSDALIALEEGKAKGRFVIRL